MEPTNKLDRMEEIISPCITDKILRESFTRMISSLREEDKNRGKHIVSLEEKIRDLKYGLEDAESEIKIIKLKSSEEKFKNILGDTKTLEDEMKIELLFEVYQKYSLVQIEERIGTKYNLTI